MAKKTLGRGLDALIPTVIDDSGNAIESDDSKRDSIYHLPLEEIHANRWQPRQDFDEASIDGLAASISSSGILQPIVVQQTDQGYELVAGERRLRAAKKAGWEKIPAIITNVDEQQRLQMALIENIQRENLNAMEEALAYQNLIQMAGCTQEELSNLVGKERSTISNSLRLLKLPVEIQQYVREGTVSSGHARAILALENPQEQFKLCNLIISKRLSVRQAEDYVKSKLYGAKDKSETKKIRLDANLQSIQDQLAQRLVTRVKIAPASRSKGGKITIDYYSNDDLERFLQIMHIA